GGAHDMDHRGGVLCLLVLDGQLQRHHGPREPTRHHDGGGVSGTLPEVGRVNFDYGGSFPPDELNAGEVEYNYRPIRLSGTEAPGISVFLKEGEHVYHTYS